jgi:hypothetical protein
MKFIKEILGDHCKASNVACRAGEVFNVIFWVYYKKIIYLRIKCSNFVWIVIH